MASRLFTLAEAVGEDEVCLFDHVYIVLPVTAKVAEGLAPLEAKYEQMMAPDTDTTPGDVIAAIGELVDVLLKPIGGGKTAPSKVIMDNWTANKLAIGDAQSMLEAIAARRPT